MVADKSFPKFQFHLEILALTIDTGGFFPHEVTGSLPSLWKKGPASTQV